MAFGLELEQVHVSCKLDMNLVRLAHEDVHLVRLKTTRATHLQYLNDRQQIKLDVKQVQHSMELHQADITSGVNHLALDVANSTDGRFYLPPTMMEPA